MPDDRWVLRAPRLNANDDSVTLTRWLAADRATVAAGEPIAEIETEKATAELAAERGGNPAPGGGEGRKHSDRRAACVCGADARGRRRHAARPERDPPSAPRATLTATAKARALAAARGVDLDAVRARGATIQERDVARHLAGQGVAAEMIDDPRLVLAGPASAHQLRVARDLRAAARTGLFTTLAYRLDLRGPERAIAAGSPRDARCRCWSCCSPRSAGRCRGFPTSCR